jgi:hypothetical protein
MDLDSHFEEAKSIFNKLKPDVDFLKRPKEIEDQYNEQWGNQDSSDEDNVIDAMFTGFTKPKEVEETKEPVVEEEIKE